MGIVQGPAEPVFNLLLMQLRYSSTGRPALVCIRLISHQTDDHQGIFFLSLLRTCLRNQLSSRLAQTSNSVNDAADRRSSQIPTATASLLSKRVMWCLTSAPDSY